MGENHKRLSLISLWIALGGEAVAGYPRSASLTCRYGPWQVGREQRRGRRGCETAAGDGAFTDRMRPSEQPEFFHPIAPRRQRGAAIDGAQVMRRFLSCVILFASASLASAEAPFFDGSFDDACKAAREKGKVLMVDFYTTWCGPCKMLDRHTWPDQAVKNWLGERTIPLKIDAEKNRPLAARYKIRSYPTMVFIRPDGSELGRTVGFQQPQTFLRNAATAIKGNGAKPAPSEEPAAKPTDSGMTKGLDKIKLARELASSGKHKEALDELLWCFDHGEELGSGFSRMRLTTVLDEIVSMGKTYSPCTEALARRRDQIEATAAKMLASVTATTSPDRGVLHKVTTRVLETAAINRVLGESKRQLALYESLNAHGEIGLAIQRMLFPDVLDLLVQQRRYEDIVNLAGDVFQRVEAKIAQCDQSNKYGSTMDQRARDNLAVYLRQQVVFESGKYYEALLGVGRINEAQKLGRRVIEFDPSATSFTTLVQHAITARAYDAAREMVAQAEATLKSGELGLVRKLATMIPAT